jgi:hypothetical protein
VQTPSQIFISTFNIRLHSFSLLLTLLDHSQLLLFASK